MSIDIDSNENEVSKTQLINNEKTQSTTSSLRKSIYRNLFIEF